MSNKTQSAFLPYVTFMVQGSVIGFANYLLAFSVLYHKALRSEKQYIVLMGLSLADAFNQTAYLSAGIYRTILNLRGQILELVPSRQCLTKPHVFLWGWSDMNAQTMLCVISVDRLISVALPLRYFGLKVTYARRLVLSCFCCNWVMGAVSYYVIYNQPQIKQITKECTMDLWVGHGPGSSYDTGLYGIHFMNTPEILALISITVFSLVPPAYFYQKRNLGTVNTTQEQQTKMRQQRKVTKSIAVSCLCTLLLYTLPYRIAHYAISQGMNTVAQTLWSFSNLNPLANFLIYMLRLPELRIALKNMILCKEMPPVLDLWHFGNSVAPQ